LMLRSALRVRELRFAFENAGLSVKLAVGGAPFRLDLNLWKKVGADATSDSAAGAVGIARRFLAEDAP
jgi:monomethylamine corrinoid protein